jgi:hypothetical protein
VVDSISTLFSNRRPYSKLIEYTPFCTIFCASRSAYKCQRPAWFSVESTVRCVHRAGSGCRLSFELTGLLVSDFQRAVKTGESEYHLGASRIAQLVFYLLSWGAAVTSMFKIGEIGRVVQAPLRRSIAKTSNPDDFEK